METSSKAEYSRPAAVGAVAGEGSAIEVDVSDEDGVVDAFREADKRLGGLDCLATCAGIYDTTPFYKTMAATFRRAHDVNVIGTCLCLREDAKLMAPGG